LTKIGKFTIFDYSNKEKMGSLKTTKPLKLVKWYSTQLEYPISNEIMRNFKKTRFFELIYSKNKNGFKFKVTNKPSNLKLNESLLFNLEVDKYEDEPTGFIKSKLSEYYSDKRISYKWFKLNQSDIKDIVELLYEIEGENFSDYSDLIEEIFSKTLDKD
jgi:hypothetical protein